MLLAHCCSLSLNGVLLLSRMKYSFDVIRHPSSSLFTPGPEKNGPLHLPPVKGECPGERMKRFGFEGGLSVC